MGGRSQNRIGYENVKEEMKEREREIPQGHLQSRSRSESLNLRGG